MHGYWVEWWTADSGHVVVYNPFRIGSSGMYHEVNEVMLHNHEFLGWCIYLNCFWYLWAFSPSLPSFSLLPSPLPYLQINSLTSEDFNLSHSVTLKQWNYPPYVHDSPASCMEVYQCPEFSVGIFLIKPNKVMPFHDHPGMHGIMWVLNIHCVLVCGAIELLSWFAGWCNQLQQNLDYPLISYTRQVFQLVEFGDIWTVHSNRNLSVHFNEVPLYIHCHKK